MFSDVSNIGRGGSGGVDDDGGGGDDDDDDDGIEMTLAITIAITPRLTCNRS